MCIFQGQAESDLNEPGKKQAQAVKFVVLFEFFSPERCAVVIPLALLSSCFLIH